MSGTIYTFSCMAMGIAVIIAVLARALGRNRISQGVGIVVVNLACLVWHAFPWLLWFGTQKSELIARVARALEALFYPLIKITFGTMTVPFQFGYQKGEGAFFAALAVQATVAASIASGLYLLLRRNLFIGGYVAFIAIGVIGALYKLEFCRF